MSLKPIVIFGAGGFAREVLALLEDINESQPSWEVLGVLDDAPERGSAINGLPVLGGQGWLDAAFVKPYVVFGVGSPSVKRKVSGMLRGRVAGFPTLIHPSVVRSKRVELGEGVVVTAGNILTTEICLGDFVMLNLMCTVGHDTRIGEFSTVSPGVNVSGNVHIGQGCDVGTGAKLIQGIGIGEWSVVGAGAVVSRSLPANCTAVGVPAKVIKEREPGWHL
jgi:sugar O-acyltransferase (sialic acid O-acetyltransferase NeuD family)